jgi:hypothetical protein
LGFVLGRKKNVSRFLGQWASTLLVLGLYDKMVDLLRRDESNR